MKNILFIAFCGAVFIILIEAQEKYATRQRLNLDHIELPHYVSPIPGGLHNYRSFHISMPQLDSVLAYGIITTVIRISGAGRIAVRKERALCESYNVGFVNIDADSILIVHGLLLKGRVLINY